MNNFFSFLISFFIARVFEHSFTKQIYHRYQLIERATNPLNREILYKYTVFDTIHEPWGTIILSEYGYLPLSKLKYLGKFERHVFTAKLVVDVKK